MQVKKKVIINFMPFGEKFMLYGVQLRVLRDKGRGSDCNHECFFWENSMEYECNGMSSCSRNQRANRTNAYYAEVTKEVCEDE